jgi:hypothetical protein
MDPTDAQRQALKAIVCHLLAAHYREVIAYGAGWSDQERPQPVGDTGRHEPRQLDVILDAELQRVGSCAPCCGPLRSDRPRDPVGGADRDRGRPSARPSLSGMIAGELAMSINTGKTHAASIYRKLAVNSRDEAVVRAGDLGLL